MFLLLGKGLGAANKNEPESKTRVQSGKSVLCEEGRMREVARKRSCEAAVFHCVVFVPVFCHIPVDKVVFRH